jgi:hypothetical protein
VTVAEDPFQSCSSNRNGGSAFMPFSAYSSVPVTTVTLSAPKEEKEEPVRNRHSFLTPEVKSLREGFGSRGLRSSSNRAVPSLSPPTVQPSMRVLRHFSRSRLLGNRGDVGHRNCTEDLLMRCRSLEVLKV